MAVQNHPQQNNNFIDPIRRLSAIFAILPPPNFFNPNHNKLKGLFKCYTIFMSLVILFGMVLRLLGRWKDAYYLFPSATLVVTDIIVAFTTTATNLATILVPTVWHLNDYISFAQICEKVNGCLMKCKTIKTKTCKTFYTELIFGHLALFSIFAYEGYVWINATGFTQYRHYIFRDFQSYHLYITTITIHHFALLTKYGFEMINDELKKLNILPPYQGISVASLEVKMEKYEYYYTVRKITQKYELQMKQIALFNTIFGWQILLMALTIMMGLLNSLDIFTLYLSDAQQDKRTLEDAFGNELVILGAVRALWHLTMSYIGSIGYIMQGSGFKEALSVIYAPNSEDKMLNGHAYVRAVRGHSLLHLALAIIISRNIDINEDMNETLRTTIENMLGAIVTVPCTRTIKAARETADICATTLLKMPIISTNPKQEALGNELSLLKDLAVHHCPMFSAAGFFKVDNSLFLDIFASVTSYVIVLIQFHNHK